MMTLFYIVDTLLILVALYTIWNLLRKVERLEDDIIEYDETLVNVYTHIENAYIRMKAIDKLGSFESDDETGYIFDEIKLILQELNDEYDLNDNEAETEG
jgi:predicted cation transporter